MTAGCLPVCWSRLQFCWRGLETSLRFARELRNWCCLRQRLRRSGSPTTPSSTAILLNSPTDHIRRRPLNKKPLCPECHRIQALMIYPWHFGIFSSLRNSTWRKGSCTCSGSARFCLEPQSLRFFKENCGRCCFCGLPCLFTCSRLLTAEYHFSSPLGGRFLAITCVMGSKCSQRLLCSRRLPPTD